MTIIPSAVGGGSIRTNLKDVGADHIRNLIFSGPLTSGHVRDHYEIYGMVEGIAARRAAANLSDAELEKLADITSQMHKDDLPERQEKLNYEFHRAINIAGGTPKLLTVLHLLSKTMPARFFEIAGGWSEIAGDQHRKIEAALRVRDGAAAEKAMSEHILSGGEYAVEMLRESGFWDNDSD